MNVKKRIRKAYFLALCLLGTTVACDHFEELNKSPDLPTEVSPGTLLTSVIFDPINPNINMQFRFIGQVMQYWVYTNQFGFSVYNFSSDPVVMDDVWRANYLAIRNAREMDSIAGEDNGYKAAARIMEAFYLVTLTDIWRDVPATEAALADEGNISPAYDAQRMIFPMALRYLEQADSLLAAGGTAFQQGGDVLFGGDALRWRKMANSLRLKYLLRVSNPGKYADAQADFERIVADPATYPIITGNDDQAVFDMTGNAPRVADFSNISDVDPITLSERIIEKMANGTPNDYDDDDPRLAFFAQHRVRRSQDTERIEAATALGYEGVPSGTDEAEGKRIADIDNALKFKPLFQQDKGLLDFGYVTYSELKFILAEARLKGWNVPGTVETHYQDAIEANFSYWNIEQPADFMDRSYIKLDGIGASADDQLTRIMEQKWVAGICINIFDTWADYKRTGKPSFTIGPQAAGNASDIPTRMFYPIIEQTVNTASYDSAASRMGGDVITVKHWYQN